MTLGSAFQKSQIYLVALVLCLIYHAYITHAIEPPPIATGELMGNDSYMRLLRVQLLAYWLFCAYFYNHLAFNVLLLAHLILKGCFSK